MAHLRLIHWNGPEGRERRLRLAALGHHVDFDEADGPGLSRILRSTTPDAFVIDLSRLPSHGREVAMWLRSTKGTRHIPIVFVDGDPEKVARIRQLLPDAVYATWPRLKTAIPKAIARPPASPVVPPSSIYSGKPAAEKLGIKNGMRVCVMGAPPTLEALLAPLPEDVRLTAKPAPDCDLFIVFVRRRQDCAAHAVALARAVTRQTVWFAWPKKTSGLATDVDGNFVRETGLATGWVDYKVCAIDATWSGLAFKRRK